MAFNLSQPKYFVSKFPQVYCMCYHCAFYDVVFWYTGIEPFFASENFSDV